MVCNPKPKHFKPFSKTKKAYLFDIGMVQTPSHVCLNKKQASGGARLFQKIHKVSYA
jgi:hypothetical protein